MLVFRELFQKEFRTIVVFGGALAAAAGALAITGAQQPAPAAAQGLGSDALAAPELVTLPEWQAVAELSADESGGLGRRAVADLAAGCYAVAHSVTGYSGKPVNIVTAMKSTLEAAGWTVTGIDLSPVGAIDGRAEVNAPGLHGLMRVIAGERRTDALLCSWNQRDPGRCRQQCGQIADRFEVPK